MPIYCSGERLTIEITDDGITSLVELARVHANDITTRMARLSALLKQFAMNGKLRSPDQFRQEGEGFFAVRVKHLRAYGWYEPNGVFVISHVIYKTETKLAELDKQRMRRNQTGYREDKK